MRVRSDAGLCGGAGRQEGWAAGGALRGAACAPAAGAGWVERRARSAPRGRGQAGRLGPFPGAAVALPCPRAAAREGLSAAPRPSRQSRGAGLICRCGGAAVAAVGGCGRALPECLPEPAVRARGDVPAGSRLRRRAEA